MAACNATALVVSVRRNLDSGREPRPEAPDRLSLTQAVD